MNQYREAINTRGHDVVHADYYRGVRHLRKSRTPCLHLLGNRKISVEIFREIWKSPGNLRSQPNGRVYFVAHAQKLRLLVDLCTPPLATPFFNSACAKRKFPNLEISTGKSEIENLAGNLEIPRLFEISYALWPSGGPLGAYDAVTQSVGVYT